MNQFRTNAGDTHRRTDLMGTSRNVVVLLAIALLIPATQSVAQESLADLMDEGGFSWILGKWATEGDGGQRIQFALKTELGGHMVTLQVKVGDYEFRGINIRRANEMLPVLIGADNMGGTAKGSWDADGDKAVLKYERTGPYGEVARIGFVYSNVHAETMKIEMYDMDSEGQFGTSPNSSTLYKRVKSKEAEGDK